VARRILDSSHQRILLRGYAREALQAVAKRFAIRYMGIIRRNESIARFLEGQ